jgi:L-ribulose-5-phosphate 4-epimerase
MTLREDVCRVNRELHRSGLVTMHSGNASGLDRGLGKLWIKPSGVDYDSLQPDSMVEADLVTGAWRPDGPKPSVDLPHHLFLYRNLPSIGGVVHTHSNFATAFAACGRPIPAVLTAIADEFGGEIPCAPYADNGSSNIGESILEHRRDGCPAILLKHHGVFAWGPDPASALKAAVMVEDVAKTVFLAFQLGQPEALSDVEIKKWWDRYQHRYGQTLDR